jgi:protein-L-isoaspartate(D-aspartate) O-methyltransferase
MDYLALRKRMVEQQLLSRGIKDQRVLEAFLRVERHRFVPEELKGNSYGDFPLSIGEAQTISQPYIVALMTECLQLAGKEKVLEIGTGSGYQAAILAELADEVYSIERLASLSGKAAERLKEMGYRNIHLKLGDGTLGWPEEAPFERIVITAASPALPLPLAEQLSEGGKIILPMDNGTSQVLKLLRKKDAQLEEEVICGCVFVPLIGKYAYQDN